MVLTVSVLRWCGYGTSHIEYIYMEILDLSAVLRFSRGRAAERNRHRHCRLRQIRSAKVADGRGIQPHDGRL